MKKQTKITLILFASIIVSVILHNVISVLFKIEEAVFFILFLISTLALMVYLVYLIIMGIKNYFSH